MADGWPGSNSTPVLFVLARETTNTVRSHQPRMRSFGLSCSSTCLGTWVATLEEEIVRVRGGAIRITETSSPFLLMSEIKLLDHVFRSRFLSLTTHFQGTTPLRHTWSSSWERARMVCTTWPSYEFGTVKIWLAAPKATMVGHLVQMCMDWCTRTKTVADIKRNWGSMMSRFSCGFVTQLRYTSLQQHCRRKK